MAEWQRVYSKSRHMQEHIPGVGESKYPQRTAREHQLCGGTEKLFSKFT